MVCVICVYGHQTSRTEAEKEAFREEVDRVAGLSDGQAMLVLRAISMRTSHRGRRKHRKIWMGNKEQGRAINGGYVEEVRVDVMDGREVMDGWKVQG